MVAASDVVVAASDVVVAAALVVVGAAEVVVVGKPHSPPEHIWPAAVQARPQSPQLSTSF